MFLTTDNVVIFFFVIKQALFIPWQVDWINQLEAGSADEESQCVQKTDVIFSV